MVEVEEVRKGGERRGGGGGGTMVASQLVLVNHFFLALVQNTPDPATAPDFNSVVVDAGCGRGCRLCSPINGCLACDPPFFLVLQRDGPRQTASCTKTCPKGFFKVKKKRNGFCSKCTMLGCEECLGPHYCFTCQHHYFNYFGRCIREPTGTNRTQHLGITTEPTLMTEDERRRDKPEETKTEKDDEGLQIMVTSPYRPAIPNTTLSSIITSTLRPTPTDSPSSTPPSGRDRGKLRPCRRRRKHRHGGKDAERQDRRRNRNKERRKDVMSRRRQCRRRGKGRRKGRRKGRKWGERRRDRKRKTTTSGTSINITSSPTTIIALTTEIPTTTQMIDLSLLGEEGQGGDSRLDASTQLDSHKFFYNRAREMARYKQKRAYRRKKPAWVRGKRVRHAKLG